MNDRTTQKHIPIEELYEDAAHWHVNTGEETIHAKRMPGRLRAFKWYMASLWLLFFVGPYIRWGDRQAILFDIPARKFHLFGVTVWPQDVWMLSLVLILLAMTLFGVTAVAGRVWCGYFCFQTVWTDVFTWIEEKMEGSSIKRRKLDAAPWSAGKVWIKVKKHTLWLLIAALTGITFAAYFTDAFRLWHDYLTLQAAPVAWVVLLMFIVGTYLLAGFLREQVCFWLCPYARIQSVMVDRDTVMPTYDYRRGEPRGRIRGKDSDREFGDCIDDKLCVAVCPTGVDIREGMQEGCITCGLCIDACNSVMDKVGRPRGLIRYLSRKEMEGESQPPLHKRPRVIVYSAIFLLALSGIVYGLSHIPPLELTVVHERQPLYTRMSDGSIQNKYTVKALNKTERDVRVQLRATGIEGMEIHGAERTQVLEAGRLIPFDIFLRVPYDRLPEEEQSPVRIVLTPEGDKAPIEYESVFIRP